MNTPIIEREYIRRYRFLLETMKTRFDTLEYFVKDANVVDENGYSTVVFQTSDKQKALDYIANAE